MGKIQFKVDGTELKKKIKDKIKKGDYEFFYKSSKNSISIRFDELVNSEFPSELNEFNLSRKRTYINNMDLIIEYNNKLFNAYNLQQDLIMAYLAIKWQIDKKGYKTVTRYKLNERGKKIPLKDEEGNYILTEDGRKQYEKETISDEEFFLKDIYNKIFTDDFVDFIEAYIEEIYPFNIDEDNNKKNKKFNPVLQFSDKHCKILHCISFGIKFVIPLITHYAKMYNILIKVNEYLERCFDYIFNIFNHGVDLYSKLWESVYSRVIVTKSSDKTFWSYVEIDGTSISKLTGSIYQKLIVDIIPKYKIHQNVVNLNHVFINNNLDYTFRNDIDINYKPLNLAQNEDDVSDFDKLSINTARIDEGKIVINVVNLESIIANLRKSMNIKIKEEEFTYYSSNLFINSLQKRMMFDFYGKYFGSTETIKYGNRNMYVMLLIIMKKILEKNDFVLLPSIITGKIIDINEKATLNKKVILDIIGSIEYEDLIDTNYSFTKTNIKEKNCLIIRILATILNNKFMYSNYDLLDNEDEEIITKNDEKDIKSEIIRFVYNMI